MLPSEGYNTDTSRRDKKKTLLLKSVSTNGIIVDCFNVIFESSNQ
jgi:hypothetical protein